MGRIDLIVCLRNGSWYFDHVTVPTKIAQQDDHKIIEWAKENEAVDGPDVIYIGVYWRDPNIDLLG